MHSAWDLALCCLRDGVAVLQHSVVRSMWRAGNLPPLQVLVDT